MAAAAGDDDSDSVISVADSLLGPESDIDSVFVEPTDQEISEQKCDPIQLETDLNRKIPPAHLGPAVLASFIVRSCDDEEARPIVTRLTHFLGYDRALYFLQLVINLQNS